jgi:hypothetical protein
MLAINENDAKALAEKLGTSDYYQKSRGTTDQEASEKSQNLVTDPFYKDAVKAIYMYYSRKIFEKYFVWTATIVIKRNNTEAKVSSKDHVTLPSLLLELEAILKSLK